MTRPTATLVRALSTKNWHPGTALYRLSTPKELTVMGVRTACSYVIVAQTPRACAHGPAETAVFAANWDGSLFGGFWDRTAAAEVDHVYVRRLGLDDGAEFPECRVVGRHDHAAALRKLGYRMGG